MINVVLVAHNLRSTHNVGSLLRTAEGLGVNKVFLTGYTPYPNSNDDARLPHESAKLTKQIQKTALGAEEYIDWLHKTDIIEVIEKLKTNGYSIVGLEQLPGAVQLSEYTPTNKVALILGREVEGLESEVADLCDTIIEIPMRGKKESFNVVQAAAMALYSMMYR